MSDTRREAFLAALAELGPAKKAELPAYARFEPCPKCGAGNPPISDYSPDVAWHSWAHEGCPAFQVNGTWRLARDDPDATDEMAADRLDYRPETALTPSGFAFTWRYSQSIVEHFDRTCQVCGYRWCEAVP
jgi:hypothetical protein